MAYSQFHDGFWTDPEIRELSSDDKLLLTWFITNPYRHYSGVYFFEFDSISKQTGLSEKTITKGMDTLSASKFIKYNPKFSMVWVIKMARHEVRKNEKTEQYSEKQTKGIANHFQTLHKCPLIKDFLEYYDTLSIPYGWGIRQEEVKEEAKEETEAEEKDISSPLRGAGIPYQQIIDLWNTYAPASLPRASLIEKRKPKIKAAWNSYPDLEWWKSLFTDLILSPWHSHQDSWQGNSFDWVLKNRTEMREKLSAKKGNGRKNTKLSPTMQALVDWNQDQDRKEEIIDVEQADI